MITLIKLQNVLVSVNDINFDAKLVVTKKLNVPYESVKTAKILRRSVDVRKKSNPCFCYSFCVDFLDKKTEKLAIKNCKNASFYTEGKYVFLKAKNKPQNRPIIVGSGPAGLFAAITLIKAGLSPIIIERGKKVEKRLEDIENFRQNNILNTSSNVQFGEGGAGTFSDGKLNTGIKDTRIAKVLELFAEFGADPDILVNAKPHIGTDRLQIVLKNIRKFILENGGEYYFETTFKRAIVSNGQVTEIICEKCEKEFSIPCETLVLAIGNAARDTFENLLKCGAEMVAKPFAVGVRIEHLQKKLNVSQYGENYPDTLPPTEYKLAVHLENGRGVYTFCMCPGGFVVNGASEENSIVTNGMSYFARDGINANSALLVGVSPEDFGKNPLDGIKLQREIETKAFELTKGYGAPCETVGSFLYGEENKFSDVSPTILPKPVLTKLEEVFPHYITDSLKKALPKFNEKIIGFADKSAVLTAPETRSSSPVKIIRNEEFESNIGGIYPTGEGAGYAGGITSSAVDGIKVAEAIINKLNINQ